MPAGECCGASPISVSLACVAGAHSREGRRDHSTQNSRVFRNGLLHPPPLPPRPACLAPGGRKPCWPPPFCPGRSPATGSFSEEVLWRPGRRTQGEERSDAARLRNSCPPVLQMTQRPRLDACAAPLLPATWRGGENTDPRRALASARAGSLGRRLFPKVNQGDWPSDSALGKAPAPTLSS